MVNYVEIDAENLKKLVIDIVKCACDLKNTHTSAKDAQVNYAAVFAQSNEEFEALLKAAQSLGKVIQNTPTGPLYKITPLVTVAGDLQLLKIRMPEEERTERGDADFTVSNYRAFKQEFLSRNGFKLIQREEFEMIELSDSDYDVLAYFSHPPLDEQLGIK